MVVFLSRFIYQRRKENRQKSEQLIASEAILTNLSTALDDDKTPQASPQLKHEQEQKEMGVDIVGINSDRNDMVRMGSKKTEFASSN